MLNPRCIVATLLPHTRCTTLAATPSLRHPRCLTFVVPHSLPHPRCLTLAAPSCSNLSSPHPSHCWLWSTAFAGAPMCWRADALHWKTTVTVAAPLTPSPFLQVNRRPTGWSNAIYTPVRIRSYLPKKSHSRKIPRAMAKSLDQYSIQKIHFLEYRTTRVLSWYYLIIWNVFWIIFIIILKFILYSSIVHIHMARI